MKSLVLVLLSASLLTTCGSKEEKTTGSANTSGSCNTALTFNTDIKPILTTNCAGCHSGYDTLSVTTTKKAQFYSEVNNSRMPQGNANFKTGTDGQKLLSYLSCSTLN